MIDTWIQCRGQRYRRGTRTRGPQRRDTPGRASTFDTGSAQGGHPRSGISATTPRCSREPNALPNGSRQTRSDDSDRLTRGDQTASHVNSGSSYRAWRPAMERAELEHRALRRGTDSLRRRADARAYLKRARHRQHPQRDAQSIARRRRRTVRDEETSARCPLDGGPSGQSRMKTVGTRSRQRP